MSTDLSVNYHPTIRDFPLGERPRERLKYYGPMALSNAELLAILIGVGTPGENVVALSTRLLSQFGGLAGFLGLNPPPERSVAAGTHHPGTEVGEAVAKALSVRQVEQRVHALLASPTRRSGRHVDRDVARLEEEIAQRVGTRVEIKSRKGGAGKLVLHYTNHEQLDALLERLRRSG